MEYGQSWSSSVQHKAWQTGHSSLIACLQLHAYFSTDENQCVVGIHSDNLTKSHLLAVLLRET